MKITAEEELSKKFLMETDDVKRIIGEYGFEKAGKIISVYNGYRGLCGQHELQAEGLIKIINENNLAEGDGINFNGLHQSLQRYYAECQENHKPGAIPATKGPALFVEDYQAEIMRPGNAISDRIEPLISEDVPFGFSVINRVGMASRQRENQRYVKMADRLAKK